MKTLKKYYLILLASLAVLILGGCGFKNQSQPQAGKNAVSNQIQKSTVAETDPMKNVKEVPGNDEASKTINEIDELLNESDSDDLGSGSLTDSNLGL